MSVFLILDVKRRGFRTCIRDFTDGESFDPNERCTNQNIWWCKIW